MADDDDLWSRLQGLPDSGDEPDPSVHEDPEYWRRPPTEVVARPAASPPTDPATDATAVMPAVRAGASHGGSAPPAAGGAAPHVEPAPAPAQPVPVPVPPQPAPARRRRWPKLLLAAAVLVLVAVAAAGLYGWAQFRSIDRIALSDVLSTGGSGTNYLIVGSDSRQGLDEGDPALVGAETLGGQRADTMLILRTDPSGTYLLSIPRDLWVTLQPSGQEQKINAAYNQGPAAVVQTVQSLGIPVHHYFEVDFASFQELVDAVGGVDVEFAFPARDERSGLNVESSGTVHLDGTQALAFVRSRNYQELKDGEYVTDPRADLGRIERQKQFMSVVLAELTSTRNPLEANAALGAAKSGLRMDDSMSFLDAVRLTRALRGAEYVIVELPVENFTAPNGSSALRPIAGFEDVVARFAE